MNAARDGIELGFLSQIKRDYTSIKRDDFDDIVKTMQERGYVNYSYPETNLIWVSLTDKGHQRLAELRSAYSLWVRRLESDLDATALSIAQEIDKEYAKADFVGGHVQRLAHVQCIIHTALVVERERASKTLSSTQRE